MLGPVLQEADCRGLLHPHTDNLEIQCPAKPRRGSWAGMGSREHTQVRALQTLHEDAPWRPLQTAPPLRDPHFPSPGPGMRGEPTGREGRSTLGSSREHGRWETKVTAPAAEAGHAPYASSLAVGLPPSALTFGRPLPLKLRGRPSLRAAAPRGHARTQSKARLCPPKGS